MPLAINSIASLLARDASDSTWEYVRKSLGSLSAEGNDGLTNMKQILDLSYIHLPDHLKTCLLHVCMYPEDREIDKTDLLRQWVAEGFVGTNNGPDAADVAEEYFEKLINVCMIQPGKIDYYTNEVLSCRVHDIILDLMRSNSSQLNFSHVIDGLKDVSGQIRRVSVQRSYEEDGRILAANKGPLEHVRSVLLHQVSHLPDFLEFKYVRVLHLEDEESTKGDSVDLTGISKLFVLRYLKVVICTYFGGELKLPAQIGELQQLETIDLQGGELERYPSDIVSLSRLSHLRYYGIKGVVLPEGIGMLKSLRTLEGVCVLRSSAENLKGLGELTNLQKLHICTTPSSQPLEEAGLLLMGALRFSISRLSASLKILNVGEAHYSLQVSSKSIMLDVKSWIWLKVPKIQVLDLRCCNFRSCPRWIVELHHLYSLSIRVREVADGPTIVGRLPSLAYFHLLICAAEETEESVVVFEGGGAFKELKHLQLRCEMNLTTCTFKQGALPKLEKLEMQFRYPFLPVGIENLPAPTLERISLGLSEEEEIEEEDDEGEQKEKLRNHARKVWRAFKQHHPRAGIDISVPELDEDEERSSCQPAARGKVSLLKGA